ncbi:MAG: C-terminal helicase domain-containing protein, partial [Akkermansiaceae bacterium]
ITPDEFLGFMMFWGILGTAVGIYFRLMIGVGPELVAGIAFLITFLPYLSLRDAILKRQKQKRGLIFCRTKAGAMKLGQQLSNLGLSVGVLQGDLMQKERDKVMRAFKKERLQFLIATDVAARGIDVEGLSFVIHHQLPDQIEYYTHRSGRTARAGKKGISIALIESNEQRRIAKLEEELGLSFSPL